MATYRFQAAYKRFWARGKQYLHFWADYYSLLSGTVTATLPSLTGFISGEHGTAGDVVGTLPSLTGSISGAHGVAGDVVGILPPLTASAMGAAADFIGTFDGTLPALTGSIAATTSGKRRGSGHDEDDDGPFVRRRSKAPERPPFTRKVLIEGELPSLALVARALVSQPEIATVEPVSSPPVAQTPIPTPQDALPPPRLTVAPVPARVPVLPSVLAPVGVRVRGVIPAIQCSIKGPPAQHTDEEIGDVLENLRLAA